MKFTIQVPTVTLSVTMAAVAGWSVSAAAAVGSDAMSHPSISTIGLAPTRQMTGIGCCSSSFSFATLFVARDHANGHKRQQERGCELTRAEGRGPDQVEPVKRLVAEQQRMRGEHAKSEQHALALPLRQRADRRAQ